MFRERKITRVSDGIFWLLTLGVFNGGLMVGFIGLYLLWFTVFSMRLLDTCNCDLTVDFMFLSAIFPAEILPFDLWFWAVIFLLAVSAQAGLMYLSLNPFSEAKHTGSLRLALFTSAGIHNLPGAFLVLTFMAQRDYVLVYLLASLLSGFGWLIFYFFHQRFTFRPHPTVASRKERLLDLLWAFSRLGLVYAVLNLLLNPALLLLPFILVGLPGLFVILLHPASFFILLWVTLYAIRKRQSFF